MKLDESSWPEIEAYVKKTPGLIIPTGSTEQHGPMGMIGTDTHCAEHIALRAADVANALVAPAIAYTPAPFNLAFPGTLSVSEDTFKAVVMDLLQAVSSQGFTHIYFLNGHGANIAPLEKTVAGFPALRVRVRSWWDFEDVDALRQTYYGEWEGMHATPSEIAITQATHYALPTNRAELPPEKLSADYIRKHSGDRHGPAAEHRARFPDGRVGSHSALASREQGAELLRVAASEVAADYQKLLKEPII